MQFILQVQLTLIVGLSGDIFYMSFLVVALIINFSYVVYGYFSFRVYMANRSITPNTPVYTPDDTPDQDEEEAESML